MCLETATLPDSTMADNVTNELLLEHLKAIQSKLAQHDDRFTAIESDLRSVKGHLASFMQTEVAQDTTMAELRTRMDRIERRLDIVD